jgi:stage V sporulation protein SpoVS
MALKPEELEHPETLTVSKKSETRKIAGAMAHALRRQDSIGVDALGSANLYTTVKAAIIASHFLKHKVHMDIKFRDRKRNALSLKVCKPREDAWKAVVHSSITVAGESDFAAVGGAIANRIREGGDKKHAIAVMAVGVLACHTTLMACALASTLLDKEDITMLFAPSFEDTKDDTKGKESITFLKMVAFRA